MRWIRFSNPMMPDELDALFSRVERAVDEHPKLVRIEGPAREPTLSQSRLGAWIDITVKLRGSRKKPSKINGRGDTPDEAADDLIRKLDHWAEAIR